MTHTVTKAMEIVNVCQLLGQRVAGRGSRMTLYVTDVETVRQIAELLGHSKAISSERRDGQEHVALIANAGKLEVLIMGSRELSREERIADHRAALDRLEGQKPPEAA